MSMPDHTDPSAPGWRPEYSGETRFGDVGSGTDFGADLYYLYRAGRNELPAVATTYSDLTTRVHRIAGPMEALFTVDGQGMECAHERLLALRNELHDVLRRTSIRMKQVGQALVLIASGYATTDQEAVAEFTRLMDEHRSEYRSGPPVVPEPPAVDAPQPPPQHDDRGLVPVPGGSP
jgi:hypothetical protein